VATRRTNQTSRTPAKKQNTQRKKPLGFLFWLVFIIVIVGLFAANRELITRNVQKTGLFDRLLNRETQVDDISPETDSEIVETPPIDVAPEENNSVAVVIPPDENTETPDEEISTNLPAKTIEPANPPVAVNPPVIQNPPKETPAEVTRSRNLYFMKVDNDGTIVRTQVSRSLAISNSPMMDVLDILLQGPNADEKRKGLESLIPQGTEILSATVRGSTAYISFSEDFQFNIYGVEGYAAQLRQIVWTVTEFPNVNDVQILLEGRRIDYLGEGIWIGSPLSRETL
jgi:spore germination protein GerM